MVKRLALALVAASLCGCSDDSPSPPTVDIAAADSLKIAMEIAFRAGANTAAKLIWENPYKYQDSLQVQDAAWNYYSQISTNRPK